VTSVAFSGDGGTLVTGGGEGTTRVWSTGSWRERAALQPPRSRALVLDVHVSDDGERVATLALDGTARIWHAEGGQPIRTLWKVASVDLSPNGERVLVGDGKATAHILRSSDGGEVGLLRGHTDTVNRARFNSRGDLIVTAGADGWVRVWQAATDGALAELTPSRASVVDAMLAADGRLVIVGGDAVRLYSCEPCLDPARLRALAKERLAARD
jgi:WD40 repeat protein